MDSLTAFEKLRKQLRAQKENGMSREFMHMWCKRYGNQPSASRPQR